jgi:sugar lactone lactonase YvrE
MAPSALQLREDAGSGRVSATWGHLVRIATFLTLGILLTNCSSSPLPPGNRSYEKFAPGIYVFNAPANHGGSIGVYGVCVTSIGGLNVGNLLGQVSGSSTMLAAPLYGTIDDTGTLYAPNRPTSTITVYFPPANGAVPPNAIIKGKLTLLAHPSGIAVDSNEYIYVANAAASATSITVYQPWTNGNTAPMRVISGPHTGLSAPSDVALDSNDNLYVTNATGGVKGGRITVYAPGASQNATPLTIEGSKTGLAGPAGIAVDLLGRIYVTNAYSNSITIYAPIGTVRAGEKRNESPLKRIVGYNTNLHSPRGIALDDRGNIYVANHGNSSVTVYSGGSIYSGDSKRRDVGPIDTIKGDMTGINHPVGIAWWRPSPTSCI